MITLKQWLEFKKKFMSVPELDPDPPVDRIIARANQIKITRAIKEISKRHKTE